VLSAIPRGKQRRTMANMKQVGEALEEYQLKNHHYPIGQGLNTLKSTLVPHYLPALPDDGWKRSLFYESNESGSDYFLFSTGQDGVMDVPNAIEYSSCENGNFESDIVLKNGMFIRFPAGKQSYRRHGVSDDVCEVMKK
jgi:hypothetical protein